ncbi:conserved hypothetical protein, membrane [Candidatus Magnetomorum sp. HK-1]|nr:conserved hypothetical protein, membrane [Candidatus Magnetomorum sp. HK-1]
MEKDTSKSTILVISMGFLVLHLIFFWKWAVIVSLVIGLIGIISPFLSKKIEWVWMKFAQILGHIIPNILLSIVFFLVLYPIAICSKFFTKDPLMLSNDYDSYFIDIKDNELKKESFKKMW